MPNSTETININGHELPVRRVVGQVLHTERAFETHVDGAGGGGWVGPNGGYVSGVTVNSRASEHQKVFVRSEAGSEESFDFRDWNLSVRPGSRLALVICPDQRGTAQVVLATCNLDTGEEKWIDLRQWAQRRGLLGGRMRVWPSIIAAIFLGGSFAIFASYARTRAGTTPYGFSDLLLASGIAFVPALIIEWFLTVLLSASDSESRRLHGLLQVFLRHGAPQN